METKGHNKSPTEKTEKIDTLRTELYKKYKRRQIAKVLNVSEIHISRLLNNKSRIYLEQYIKLKELIK